jgi:hypothetical protein
MRISELDPVLLYKGCQLLLQEARPVARTKEKMKERTEMIARAYAHLPPRLRRPEDVMPVLRKADKTFLLVQEQTSESTDLVIFNRPVDVAMHVRVLERSGRATATLYKDGGVWDQLGYVDGFRVPRNS